MNADPNRIVVSETDSHTCNVHTVLVHHESFPEVQVEGMTAEKAAGHLVLRLEAAQESVADALHREAIQCALADTRAFLDRETAAHLSGDYTTPHFA